MELRKRLSLVIGLIVVLPDIMDKDELFRRKIIDVKELAARCIALHAVPAYRACTYLASVFPAPSTSFSSNFSNPQRWEIERLFA